MTNEYLTSHEAATELNVTIQWIVRLTKAKKLQGEKRGRDWFITRDSIERYKEIKYSKIKSKGE